MTYVVNVEEDEAYHGVGPQNIEYENTCSTAKAINVSPPWRSRGESRLGSVPGGAKVKWPARPAMMEQIASSTDPVSSD